MKLNALESPHRKNVIALAFAPLWLCLFSSLFYCTMWFRCLQIYIFVFANRPQWIIDLIKWRIEFKWKKKKKKMMKKNVFVNWMLLQFALNGIVSKRLILWIINRLYRLVYSANSTEWPWMANLMRFLFECVVEYRNY